VLLEDRVALLEKQMEKVQEAIPSESEDELDQMHAKVLVVIGADSSFEAALKHLQQERKWFDPNGRQERPSRTIARELLKYGDQAELGRVLEALVKAQQTARK